MSLSRRPSGMKPSPKIKSAGLPGLPQSGTASAAPAPLVPATATSATTAFSFPEIDRLEPAAQIMGDAGSISALSLIQQHVDTLRRADLLRVLRDGLTALKNRDWALGAEMALKALHIDEKCSEAWHVLAVARDKLNDVGTAYTCYETALKLSPDNAGIMNDLGRLAYKLGEHALAVGLFKASLSMSHANLASRTEVVNNLGSALREMNKLDEAIELLKDELTRDPSQVQLWNVLGTAVNARGDIDTAAVFYEQAIALDPKNAHAIYNLGNVRDIQGHYDVGIPLLHKALSLFKEQMQLYTCRLSLGFAYLAKGDLKNGWEWYHSRQEVNISEQMDVIAGRPRWKPDNGIAGKRLVISGEQGLGDEILFGTILPDLMQEIGPDGRICIAVEPRLVPLFRRSFPEALVVKHHTTKRKGRQIRIFPEIADWSEWDNWAYMGDFLSRYRSQIDDFPTKCEILKPDPLRIQYWKETLSALNDRPKVGLLWKSLINSSRRNRYYSPFDQWKEILSIEGIQFVNLQYGDTTAEMEEAKAMGLDIWTPPGINLKDDLDDLSALCVAMDCILGPANATSNIAGGGGGTVWLLAPRQSWNCLGTQRFPWYPETRVFFSDSLMDWSEALDEMKSALIETFVDGRRRVA